MSSKTLQHDEEHRVDESSLLLPPRPHWDDESQERGESQPGNESNQPSGLARGLYISHFLSTWNSRVFEFGAVLYLATIYPGTLLPLSVYAFTRGLSAILFASSVGYYIDTGNRIQVVRVSIVGQRVAVATSCVAFYLLSNRRVLLSGSMEKSLLVLVAILACIEKLCSILNLVSVEKDWAVVVADGDQAFLAALNAQLRRIDLVCKLLGPLFIALLDGYSTQVAILVNLVMNLASVVVEYFAIARVYCQVPELQQPKPKPKTKMIPHREDSEPDTAHSPRKSRPSRSCWKLLKDNLERGFGDFSLYVKHRAFLPSFAGALLYLTVLNFAGQMVTYLLAAGFDSTQVGIARTLSVVFEITATWVAPWLIGRLGPVRAGLWLSSCQALTLVAGTVLFWVFQNNSLASAGALVGATIVSRVGLRGFDLCAQIIVQKDVEADIRGAFSSVEAGWQSGLELLSYLSTIVFSRPDQFKWPALISVLAVVVANGIYTTYAFGKRRRSDVSLSDD